MTRVLVVRLSRGVVFLAAVVPAVARDDSGAAAQDGHGGPGPLIVHPAGGPDPAVSGGVVDLG